MITNYNKELILNKLQNLGEIIPVDKKIAVIIDRKVNEIYGAEIKAILKNNCILWIDTFEGEAIKQLEHIATVSELMLQNSFQKQDIVLAIGGGAITDFAGFLASIYKRGCELYYLPTTLLAMADASIGGKTALNLGNVKNSIGSFYLANKVIIYTPILQTISDNDLKSGWAEIIKHEYLQGNFDCNFKLTLPDASKIIENINFKNSIINADFQEKNLRKILNFGHTVGHSLESLALHKYEPVPHGFAIAAGMIIETEISFQAGYLNEVYKNKIQHYLKKNYPPIYFEESDIESLLFSMHNDKKNIQNNINFTLLSNNKEPLINIIIDESLIVSALLSYKNNY